MENKDIRAGGITNPKGKERYRKEEKNARQKEKGKSTCPRGKMEDHASNGEGQN